MSGRGDGDGGPLPAAGNGQRWCVADPFLQPPNDLGVARSVRGDPTEKRGVAFGPPG
jgi:hypothetical protein